MNKQQKKPEILLKFNKATYDDVFLYISIINNGNSSDVLTDIKCKKFDEVNFLPYPDNRPENQKILSLPIDIPPNGSRTIEIRVNSKEKNWEFDLIFEFAFSKEKKLDTLGFLESNPTHLDILKK
ncbi:MAG: hypothetical protein ACTSUV_01605 [Candidatus Ranarchaeia archaeon]